ncbi:glycerophosphodiester phosphodiesterase domain protein [Mycobacteroides abscessus MAB_082312_2258]|nr:glycerophosphodiester phosphodiesterase domain protein [Mycobacteroides abscessus MAB_082312_2258]
MKRIAAVLAVTLALVSCGDEDTKSFDLQAHRGGRGETTEESLRAFAKALELGSAPSNSTSSSPKTANPWSGTTR